MHPQPTDMTMSKVLSTQKTLKKWEFQSLLFPLKAQIPTVPSGTCFWACLHRVLWKSGESWRWGDKGGSLIPGSPPLPPASLQGLAKAASLRASCVAGNNASLFWQRKGSLILPLWMAVWEEDPENVAQTPLVPVILPARPWHRHSHHMQLGEGNEIRALFPLHTDKICPPLPCSPSKKKSS